MNKKEKRDTEMKIVRKAKRGREAKRNK